MQRPNGFATTKEMRERRSFFAAALGVALASLACASAGTASATGDGAGAEAPTDPARREDPAPAVLYVANQEAARVTVIDTETGAVTAVIDLEQMGFGANAKPHDVAVEPDGSFWYVSLIGANRVLKFDRENRLVGTVEFERPGMLAVHPSEDVLWVGRSMAAVNPPQRIGRIVRSTLEIEEFDVFIPRPHALVISPDGQWVFTGSLGENTLVAVDSETGEAELTRLESPDPHVLVQFAISPDGNTLVATAQLTGRLLVFDVSEAPAIRLVREIPVEAEPWHPVYSPDGRWVWFGNMAANAVTVVDAGDWTISSVIRDDGLAEPHGTVISPDGRRAYVSNRNMRGSGMDHSMDVPGGHDMPPGKVVVIDAQERRVLQVIDVAPYAAGLVLGSP